MSDDAEKAKDMTDKETAARVAAAAKAAQAQKRFASLTHCLECGDPIPERRRQAQKGCEYCIDCQKVLDAGGGFWP